MRKRIILFLIGIMLCVSSCNTRTEDNTIENVETEQTVSTEEIVTQTTAEIQADAVDTKASRLTYAGERYDWQGVSIIIPEEWESKYSLKDTKDDLVFYQKSSNDKDVTMGWLCSISIRKEYYNDIPGTTLIAYTKDGIFYYLTVPTDVTFFAEDEEIASEYTQMASQCEWMAGSMTSTSEPIYFDGNQYVLLTSSMYLIEDYQMMNLSNNNLWIARNEIYARHGKVFENVYLDSYFRSCSWYHPVEGKIEVSEDELSVIEQENLKKIIAAEKAYAEAHPYPQQYETNTRVVKRLRGNEIPFDIIYETSFDEHLEEYTSILKIDGKEYDLEEYIHLSNPVQDVFYITDIAEDIGMGVANDGLEIAILDNGPSDDPITHFFKFDKDIIYIGYIPGFPFKDYGNGIANKDKMTGLDGFTHQNGIYGTITTDLIETAYIDEYYWYDKSNLEFKAMEVGLHNYKWQKAHELYVELPVYFTMDENSPTITMMPQKEIYFIKTDNKEWILIRSKDGTEGYIYVKNGIITNISLPAEEVFSDLHFFG